MLCITNEAGVIINELRKKAGAGNKKLTIMSSGTGCGSPILKVDMREPLEDDTVRTIDGYEFHIRPDVVRYLEDAELAIENTFWGKKISIKTVYGCQE